MNVVLRSGSMFLISAQQAMIYTCIKCIMLLSIHTYMHRIYMASIIYTLMSISATSRAHGSPKFVKERATWARPLVCALWVEKM